MKSRALHADATAELLQVLLVFAVFTFLFHFTWEILQAPLFARMPVMSHWQATLVCLKATFGDVGIALASFAAGALSDKSWSWFAKPSRMAFAAYLATGIVITIAFEWYAVYWAGRWAYSDLMPLFPFVQVGLAPVLQWVFMPIAVIYFLRCHDPAKGTQWL